MKLKKAVIKYLPVKTVERIRIGGRNFAKKPPVLVYQVGKVGSSTVYKSLKTALKRHSVYHIHALTDQGIAQREKRHRSVDQPYLPHHLIVSKILNAKLKKYSNLKMDIVTLIRDPVGRFISSIFQDPDKQRQFLLGADGKISKAKARAYIEQRLSESMHDIDHAMEWFDRELKQFCGIDVYAHPFDSRKGFAVYENQKARVLMLRMEDLDHCFHEAMQTFFGLGVQVPMIRNNERTHQGEGSVYADLKKEVHLPRGLLEEIYKDSRVRHFYGDQEEQLMDKWTHCFPK